MGLLARRNLCHDKVRFAVPLSTDEPSEHLGTKILEALVELDTGQRLPLGLRVGSFVERSTAGDRQLPHPLSGGCHVQWSAS